MNDFARITAFERELRDELQEFTVPAEFADRVALRLRQREAVRRQRVWQRAIAAVLLLAAGLGGAAELHHRAQLRRAAQARADFARAMRITGRSLLAVNRALNRLDRTAPNPGSAAPESMPDGDTQ